MNKYELIKAALDLPEWERKRIAIGLIASTLNPIPVDEVVKFLEVGDEDDAGN